MSRSRASRRGDSQNLDSLLDTMANVTGILIVLLAVTQISVGDAMDRLREQLAMRPELTREALALAEAEAAELREALAPRVPDEGELRAARRTWREELAALRARNAEIRGDIEAAGGGSTDPDELRRRIARSEGRASALEAQIASTKQDLSGLQQELGNEPGGPLSRETRLPDPRPPPSSAKDVIFFARYGRIFRADIDQLGPLLRAGLRAATGNWRPGPMAPTSTDRAKMVDYFQHNDVGNSALRWHVLDLGPGLLFAQLEWRRPDHGETLEAMKQTDSVYRRELLRHNPRRVYFRFFVWDDSFDVYLSARETATEAGFSAGWIALAEHEPIRENLLARGRRPLID